MQHTRECALALQLPQLQLQLMHLGATYAVQQFEYAATQLNGGHNLSALTRQCFLFPAVQARLADDVGGSLPHLLTLAKRLSLPPSAWAALQEAWKVHQASTPKGRGKKGQQVCKQRGYPRDALEGQKGHSSGEEGRGQRSDGWGQAVRTLTAQAAATSDSAQQAQKHALTVTAWPDILLYSKCQCACRQALRWLAWQTALTR